MTWQIYHRSTNRAPRTTSVVIAPGVEPVDDELAISSITVAELHFGVLVAKTDAARAERLRRLSIVQRRFDPLPVDDAVADSYGRIAAAVSESGRNPRARSVDLLIAATAHAHDAKLSTKNPSDFLGTEDLVDVVPV